MDTIGARLGPFDVTLIESGQYDGTWPDWHIGPEQAVRGHRMVGGRWMIPIHWGLVQLAYHGWTEPIERTVAAAASAGVDIVAPKPGESVEPDTKPVVERWWPNVPWKTAAERPIVSSQVP
jgi:L-ascorbate metabolism protein UlaG (beta-lactamase superfamily)